MAIHIPGLIAIIVFYLLILGVGLFAAWKTGRKGGTNNTTDVMLAGRNIGLVIGCFTMTATWVGGGFLNGTSEIVVEKGFAWCQAPIGYSISLIFGGLFFAEKMRRRKYGTMLDPFNRRYGDLMGALLYIPAMLGELFWSAAILSALGATLAVILGIDTTISVIISAAISLMYTLVGGLYSVAYTDVIQLICIFVGLWTSVPFAMTNDAFSSIEVTSNSTWMGEIATTDIGIYCEGWLLLICGGLPWQVYFQRVLSAKNEKIAKWLSFVGGFGCMFMAVPAVIIGAVAAKTDWNMTMYDKQVNGTIPSKELSLTLPLVLRYLTPDVVTFIGLGAVSAAVMSSTDSSFLSSSSMFARNVFGVVMFKLTGKFPTDRVTVWVMRGAQLVLAICACAMAIAVSSVYYLFYLCSDLVFCILFPQLVCAIYLLGTNTYGSLSGFVIGLLFRLLGGEPALGLPATIRYPWYDEKAGQRFPYRTLTMLISLTTIITVSYLVAYLFKSGKLPMKADIFRCFHRQTVTSLQSHADGYVKDEVKGEVKEEVNVNSELPPGYQPYIGEYSDETRNGHMKGQNNPAFQPDNARIGRPISEVNNDTNIHQRLFETRL